MRALMAASAAIAISASAFADLKVMDTEDVVRLVSGEEVRGTVIAVGIKAVVVIVGEAERVIPRNEVASVERGEVRPTIKGYQTEAVEGVKVVVGEGYRDSGSFEGEEAAVAARPEKPKPKKGARKGGKPVVPKGTVDELMKDPKVRDIVRKLGGRDKAMNLLEQNQNNPMVRKMMEQLLKTGKLPPGLDKLFK